DARGEKLTYALDGSSWGCPGASPVGRLVGLTKHQVSRRPAVPPHSRAAGYPGTAIFMGGGEPQASDDWWRMQDRAGWRDRERVEAGQRNPRGDPFGFRQDPVIPRRRIRHQYQLRGRARNA